MGERDENLGLDVKKFFFQTRISRTSPLVTIIWEVIGKGQAQLNLKELLKPNRDFKSASLKMLFVFGCFTVFFLQGNISNSYACPFQTKEQGVHCGDAWARTKNNRNLETESHQGVWRSSKAGNSGLRKKTWKRGFWGRKKIGHLARESESDTFNIKIRQRTLESLQNDLFVFDNFSFMFLQISPTLCSFVNIIRTWHCC